MKKKSVFFFKFYYTRLTGFRIILRGIFVCLVYYRRVFTGVCAAPSKKIKQTITAFNANYC